MIGIIYPKDDWTAADLAIKIKALGANSPENLKIYSTPKNTRRDEEEIKMKLRKVNHGLFIAYDKLDIDKETGWELNFLLERNVPIFSIVPEGMQKALKNMGIKTHIYSYEPNNIIDFNNTIKSILSEMGDARENQNEGNIGELLALLALIGIAAFFLYLLFGKKE